MAQATQTATLNFKTDKKLKAEAQTLAKSFGVPLSAVLNDSLRRFVEAREVSFSDGPRFRPEVAREIDEMRKDARAGKNLLGPFSSVKELMADLES
ncbi:MAG: DNA-damage-inducible protein J [Candidatus Azotimanducaceae bacterium]|jgi:DNA-damage-inducible protein J